MSVLEYDILQRWKIADASDLGAAIQAAEQAVQKDSLGKGRLGGACAMGSGLITMVLLAKADRPEGGASYVLELS